MVMRRGTRTIARRGVTAVLAMLYLTLMASLALGFYSASNTAAIVSSNEQKVERTRLAAESGLDFARFHVSKVLVPAKTPPLKHFTVLSDQMSTRLNGSDNIDKGNIYTDGLTIIRVPADPTKFIKSDDKGSEFQFTITDIGDRKIRISAVGRNMNTISVAGMRMVQLDFELQQNQSKVFSYGIATMGTVTTSGSARLSGSPDPTKGSILSLSESTNTPVVISGKEVSGDISVTNPNANVVVSGASVGGTTDSNVIQAEHVHKGVEEPEFPTVDTSMFIPYAKTVYVPGKTTYSNIIIPPNTNPNFASGTVIKGVVYVKTPNRVTFNGHASLQGVIVTDTEGQVGNMNTNTISFSGGFGAKGVETLDPSYGDLRNLTGSFLLLPGFSVNFTGNFGAISGTIVVDKASIGGSASGTLNGSLIILKDTPLTLSGNAHITAGEGVLSFPTGLKFSNHYVPLPGTYDEVKAK
jgi:hypothetical protein